MTSEGHEDHDPKFKMEPLNNPGVFLTSLLSEMIISSKQMSTCKGCSERALDVVLDAMTELGKDDVYIHDLARLFFAGVVAHSSGMVYHVREDELMKMVGEEEVDGEDGIN